MSEEWRPVLNWEGFYEVSSHGRVRRPARTTPGRWPTPMHFKERILDGEIVTGGYVRVNLTAPGRSERILVHRAVLAAFVGPCPEGMEAMHIDHNPANNALSNLQWGTPSANVLAQVKRGTHNKARLTRCPQGHPYDAPNTYVNPRTGGRTCRECKRLSRKAAA